MFWAVLEIEPMNSYNTEKGNSQSWMYIVQMKRERLYSISGVLAALLICLALSKMMCSPGPDILLSGWSWVSSNRRRARTALGLERRAGAVREVVAIAMAGASR